MICKVNELYASLIECKYGSCQDCPLHTIKDCGDAQKDALKQVRPMLLTAPGEKIYFIKLILNKNGTSRHQFIDGIVQNISIGKSNNQIYSWVSVKLRDGIKISLSSDTYNKEWFTDSDLAVKKYQELMGL